MSAGVLLNQASAAQTASGTSGPILVGFMPTIAVDVNVSTVSGSTPSMTLYLERLGADGVWYEAWSSSAITAAGQTSTSIGPGCATAQVLTGSIRLRWAITGTSPSFTFSASIVSNGFGS